MESQFVINHYAELEELLKYLKYGVDLTQKDLKQIYKKLIANNGWLKNKMELFGWKELDHGIYYSCGIETIPIDIYTSLNDISY